MANKSEDLEVTGVSRSGRVRKKSSKLMDFESPEEAEFRPKKASNTPKSAKPKAGKSPVVPPLSINLLKKQVQQHPVYEDEYSDEISDEFGGGLSKNELYEDDFDANMSLGDDIMHKSVNPMKSETSDEDEDEESMDLSDSEASDNFTDTHSSTSSKGQHSVGQMHSSLYLTEKSKKKMAVKDAKVIVSRQKTQRKDKGKTRITAYMVWAKEMRSVVSHQNPDMDFASVSKRLGELWSNVSKAERMTWRTRALRLANKAAVTKGGMISTGAPKSMPPPKESPTRTKPNAASPKRVAANQQNKGRSRTTSGSTTSTPARQILSGSDGFDNITGSETFDGSLSLSSPPTIPPSSRAGEMEPLDVASHLHLLGESLSVIGTRLKEHEGQIAVSGSLSVLLDSVLCALGPLLCLTRLLPETNGCPPETLSRILDNIAYVMPGL